MTLPTVPIETHLLKNLDQETDEYLHVYKNRVAIPETLVLYKGTFVEVPTDLFTLDLCWVA